MTDEQHTSIPDWVVYPGDEWEMWDDPAAAGLDADRWREFVAGLDPRGANWESEDHSGSQWGVVLTRGGRIIGQWGDPHYRWQTASVGKAFTWAVFGLAEDAGMVSADDLVRHYCSLVYARCGSYVETARRLGLDRRTVRARVDERLLETLRVTRPS